MLFFPYKADLEQWRFPLVTLLVCAICIIVYSYQYEKQSSIDYEVVSYCNKAMQNNKFRFSLSHISIVTGLHSDDVCKYMLRMSHTSEQPEQVIHEWAYISKDKLKYSEQVTRERIKNLFLSAHAEFSLNASYPLTQNLWFSPEKIDLVKMVTSSFAHADLEHLFGNILFFFVFAATVELVIGSVSLVVTIVLLAITTNCFYAFTSFLNAEFIPTMGLSGVVFGMMGLFVCFLPRVGIRCFFWFFIVYRRVVIPSWILVSSYVGWSMYDWLTLGADSNVNFIVHISGALFGYLIGLTVFRISKLQYTTATTALN
ncbi:MAG: hypothetical protein DRQ44_02620 [Gammaproteobacteria bacterium]|nr:MAG: hypothetical protein DRQ44_02620 [Gammaproteobacteria bacterium]